MMASQPDKQPFVKFPKSMYDVYREEHPGDRVPVDPPLHRPLGASGLHDVLVSRPWLSSGALLGILIVTMMLVVIMPSFSVAISMGLGPVASSMLVAGVAWPFMYLLIRLLRARARRKVRDFVGKNPECAATELACAVFAQRPFDHKECPKELVQAAAAAGRGGTTIRVYHHGTVLPVEPLNIVFEPRPLIESDPTFLELEASTTDPSTTSNSESTGGRHDEQLLKRFLLRNLKLRGGWIILLCFAPHVFLAGLEAYRRGIVTPRLGFWIFLTLTVLLPVGRGKHLLESSQWLAVPGGLLVRKGKRRSTKSELHVFERKCSVLLASRFHKMNWLIFVSDGEATEVGMSTERETQLALRAWLSPLEPPRVEQFRDME